MLYNIIYKRNLYEIIKMQIVRMQFYYLLLHSKMTQQKIINLLLRFYYTHLHY